MNSRPIIMLLAVLIAFAGNSVLARMALWDGEVDPWSFTAIRLMSGALMLAVLTGRRSFKCGSFTGAIWLTLYALLFSLAYVKLATGTGALILFAAVQITMIGGGILQGERMSRRQLCGLALAGAGLIILMQPGLERPVLSGALMMSAAGIGWGLYSLKGRGSVDPLAETSGNFIRAALIILPLTVIAFKTGAAPSFQPAGIIYAVISGVVTSALGYALWYKTLPYLTRIQASVSQLSVPVIAALGGVIILLEPVTLTFSAACLIILCGLGMALIPRR